MRCTGLIVLMLFSGRCAAHLPSSRPASDSRDILIADFESPTYGDWTTRGECFGPRPARGTLANQMPVSGFLGHGLVNSFLGGDQSTGTLTSPAFKIERRYIGFLIGGGRDPEKLCLNLVIDGRVVRSTTGPNDRPGGGEALGPDFWDVGDFIGRSGVIQIVDQATGGWGHINVDQIYQSDSRPPGMLFDARRELTIEKRYLHLPIRNGATKRRLTFLIDGQTQRSYEIELADAEPDWWAAIDVAAFHGRRAVLIVDRIAETSTGISSIAQSDDFMNAESLYRETLRPQFHFSPRRGWTNDANGLVFYKGEYHLFFQHNPVGTSWGNMTWGHAVSPDLLHWTELAPAIYPDRLGTVYSGSAVVDWENTAGFQTGDEKTIVCIYTSAGGTSPESKGQPFTQSIAYSNDRGRTWSKYDRNPVLAHVAGENRDPKVIWHAATKKWVMSLYLEGNRYALFSSPNLKDWTNLSEIPPFDAAECPDLFELPVDGDAKNKRWIFWGANGKYLIGRFDGAQFTREAGPFLFEFGSNSYAAQSYSDIPVEDGRRIQIAWMNGGQYPNMPFNQQMSFPSELTLRTFADGIRMCRAPVAEIAKLYGAHHVIEAQSVAAAGNALKEITGVSGDLRLEVEPRSAETVTLTICGTPLTYDTGARSLHLLGKSVPLEMQSGRVKLRVIVDSASIEVFAAEGRVSLSSCFLPRADDPVFSLTCSAGEAFVDALEWWELKFVWQR